jgi:hypothetical protein
MNAAADFCTAQHSTQQHERQGVCNAKEGMTRGTLKACDRCMRKNQTFAAQQAVVQRAQSAAGQGKWCGGRQEEPPKHVAAAGLHAGSSRHMQHNTQSSTHHQTAVENLQAYSSKSTALQVQQSPTSRHAVHCC